MKDFWFCLKTKIIFGCGTLESGLRDAGGFGKKALLITGKDFAKKTGLLERVKKTLREINLSYEEFCGVEENPSIETVNNAADLCRGSGCEFVIGIGGGSAMDAAKAAAIGAVNAGPLRNYFGEDMFPNEPLPIVAIPTTSGTGSEITRFAIITDRKNETKKTICSLKIMPGLSICDPELTYSLPKNLTAFTGMDAMTHGIEAYLSNAGNPISDALALKSVEMVKEFLPRAVMNPSSKDAREEMMLASLIAGMALNHAGTIINHGMGYSLTLDCSKQHGEANALLIPYVLEFLEPHQREKIDTLKAIFGSQDIKETLTRFNEAIGIPSTLSKAGIEAEKLPLLARHAVKNCERSVKKMSIPITLKDFELIYKNAFGA